MAAKKAVDAQAKTAESPTSLALVQRESSPPKPRTYPNAHLLGIPQEVRDGIFELVIKDSVNSQRSSLGARPATGFSTFQLVCRQMRNETSKFWNYTSIMTVPRTRLVKFICQHLHTDVLESNLYQRIHSLSIEIPHTSSRNVFECLAVVLKYSSSLEELRLFAVGKDGFGRITSSVAHPCGKHDNSAISKASRLFVEGQDFERRLILVNSIQYLQNLRVLVLDNFNLPILESQVLSNKPHLQKLYISADPRTVLHGEYRYRNQNNRLGLGSLMFAFKDPAPPIKELRVDSNAIFPAYRMIRKVSASLEVFDWAIPDLTYQSVAERINFFAEATEALDELQVEAKNLRELRICAHNEVTEDILQTATFLSALRFCIAELPRLQVLELHIRIDSPWFAREVIEAIPPSVTRLYLSDTFVKKSVRDLTEIIQEKTQTPIAYAVDTVSSANWHSFFIGEDLSRRDFIPFSHNQLAFVGYEYDTVHEERAGIPSKSLYSFYKMNGRLLDKERNRHLACLEGKPIPYEQGATIHNSTAAYDRVTAPPTDDEIASNREQLEDCGLHKDGYFGQEDDARAVFDLEPVAPHRCYTYPEIVDVSDHFTFCNHWLSK